MKLDFRIDWGYQLLYSRRHYHPVYVWDGHLQCLGGRILACRQLDYPVLWFGPGHSPRETPLERPVWRSATRRGLAGVRVEAEAGDDATFELFTQSGNFTFRAADIFRDGRLVFPVGPKYGHCHVTVTRSGYLWFRPPPAPGQQVWEADDLPLPVRDWARMRTAWLEPGRAVAFDADIPESRADFREAVLHLCAMAARRYTPGDENQVHDYFPMELRCDGAIMAEFTHYFREHDTFMQMLEDVWVRFPVTSGRHRLELVNRHAEFPLLLSRVTLDMRERRHKQLSLPPWALAGEPLTGRIFAVRADHARIAWPGGACELALAPGWNSFPFSLAEPGVDVPVAAGDVAGVVPAVYALADETPEVKVGFDLTTVPHDDSGEMDWLLDYTWRTRLGNLAVFRSFLRTGPESRERRPVAPELLAHWGECCRRHRIWAEAATDFDDGALVKAAGELLHSVGMHEYPGAVYARDPAAPWASPDMKTAAENYLRYLRIEIDRAHATGARAAFGDASGGHRHGYLAGADFIRTETMVPHTQHLCSQARPAAEALGGGEWGVHIAIHHPVQPYFENHLGLYFLSLYQPWMMGASMMYEEDSLFLLFKEERQAWDDALTRGKRDMTRAFFRFAKTHPRQARVRRRIAFLEGRHAAPFNGFICGGEQDPHYSVWGLFGNDDPTWGHGQPEKCRHLLDVLMPGASTHPLRQRFDRRRFFFSGTPYGDFDETPVEASAEYLGQYALLLNLGWHTMNAEDYAKLAEFVRGGGTLFTGLPQFSTHVRRDFLRDWRDLALWNGGDLVELCGVEILGPGDEYSGQWNAVGRETFPEPELSGLPNDAPGEDGPCRLAELELRGGEPVAWDAATGKPLLVKRRCGAGHVYLLAAWAYPGHERLRDVAASWLARLAEEHRGDVYVEDPSREVFWNLREEGGGAIRLMLLNTDWTARGHYRDVKIVAPEMAFPVRVAEREPKILTLLPGLALEPDPDVHVEIVRSAGKRADLRLHGTGRREMRIHRPGGSGEIADLDFTATTVVAMTL